MDNKPSMMKATVIGGFLAALLSAIPFVNCLNLLCCSLVIGGGLLSAFLYSREVEAAGGTFAVGPGAIVGALTGLWYAIGSVLGALLKVAIVGASATEQWELVREQMEQSSEIPQEAMEFFDQISNFMADSGGLVLVMLVFGFSLLVGLVFCTVGGLIGGALFKKNGAPTPPPIPSTQG